MFFVFYHPCHYIKEGYQKKGIVVFKNFSVFSISFKNDASKTARIIIIIRYDGSIIISNIWINKLT